MFFEVSEEVAFSGQSKCDCCADERPDDRKSANAGTENHERRIVSGGAGGSDDGYRYGRQGRGLVLVDLVNRHFRATGPHQRWATDFTYVRTKKGFVYVSLVINVYAQRIIGFSISTTKDVHFVKNSLHMALWTRSREHHPVQANTLVHHSDAGSQYTNLAYSHDVEAEHTIPSIGSVGDSCDNALAETVIGLPKTECIRSDVFHRGPWRDCEDVEAATSTWVHWWNTQRLHSRLDHLSLTE